MKEALSTLRQFLAVFSEREAYFVLICESKLDALSFVFSCCLWDTVGMVMH
jgi:hypothetical protein